jgi:hypothetical protein
MNRLLTLSALIAAGFAGGMGLLMGPPMICNPVECGEVANLPTDKPGKGEAAKALANLPGFLSQEKSILAHMEALRRAAIVMQGDEDSTARLVATLACRTLNADAAGDKSAGAWFDIAFFIGCLNQLRSADTVGGVAEVNGVRGYGYMKKALELAPSNGEMQFGAALMVHPVMRSRDHFNPSNPGLGDDMYDQHLRLAVAGAKPGSLLEKNLKAHFQRWGGSFDAVKTAAK